MEAAYRQTLEQFIQAKTKPSFNVESLYDPNFPHQTAFIKDPARLKALFCTRRAAKSYTSGLYLVKECLENPGTNCLFIALTRDSAKGIIWKDILKDINFKNDLGIHFNETELTATFPNGSVIKVTGVDSEADEMNKLLGKWYRLVIIDEASMYSVDLSLLVYGILKPAMADKGGTICMMGTASNIVDGLFFNITTGLENGWKLFQWTALDNPHVAKQWQEELDEIKRMRPLFMQTALFKQWYLNEWVIDEDAKVYKFNAARNCHLRLPPDITEWNYVLGVDLAHSPDSTAFVVGAYSTAHPKLYIPYVFKALKMDITDVANKIKELEQRYKFEVKVVDGANKQAVAELNNRHNTNLIPADKTGKIDFILLMNDDFIQQKIIALPGTDELQAEWGKLTWITDGNGKVKEPKKENPNIHQDLADAALYVWRYCYTYLMQTVIPFQDKALQSVWETQHIEKMQQQVIKKMNKNEIDLEWDEAWNDEESF